MLPILLVLLIAAIALTPYVIMLIKRHKMLKRIKIVAAKSGFKMKSLNKLVFFAWNTSKKYDFIFVGEKSAYAVKLWSSLYSDSTLVLGRGDSFYISRRVSEPFLQKNKGDYNFREPRRQAPETKLELRLKRDVNITPVVLIYPKYKTIIKKKGNDILVYEQGDIVFGKRIYYPEGFERLLKRDGGVVLRKSQNLQKYSNK